MLQTHTQNMSYLLLFYCKNDYANVPQCYTVPVFLVILTQEMISLNIKQMVIIMKRQSAYYEVRTKLLSLFKVLTCNY